MTEETFQRAKELHDEIVRLDELLTTTANLSDDNVTRVIFDGCARPTIVFRTDDPQLRATAVQCAKQLATALSDKLLQTRKMFDEL